MLLREVKMSKLSKCLGMPVIIKSDARLVGRIKNVYFDKNDKSFAYFCIISETDEEFLLPVASAIPRDAILLENDSAPIPAADIDVSRFAQSILGVPAFSLSGAYKGAVLDAQFAASGKLTKLTLESGDITPASIARFGDVILLKAAKPSSQPRIPRPKKDYPVSILSSPSEAQADIISPPPPAVALAGGEPMFSQGALNMVLGTDVDYEQGDSHTPTRVICDYEFLLGRTLGADLRTYAGELLARKGTVVTPAIVELARGHGKLVDLTLSSEKPKP